AADRADHETLSLSVEPSLLGFPSLPTVLVEPNLLGFPNSQTTLVAPSLLGFREGGRASGSGASSALRCRGSLGPARRCFQVPEIQTFVPAIRCPARYPLQRGAPVLSLRRTRRPTT